MYKTHTCGELRLANSGTRLLWQDGCTAPLAWRTDFLDLRDRFGIVQIVADPSSRLKPTRL